MAPTLQMPAPLDISYLAIATSIASLASKSNLVNLTNIFGLSMDSLLRSLSLITGNTTSNKALGMAKKNSK
jgi:hypothetical protein